MSRTTALPLVDYAGHYESCLVTETQLESCSPIVETVAALCHLYSVTPLAERCLMICHHGQEEVEEAVAREEAH